MAAYIALYESSHPNYVLSVSVVLTSPDYCIDYNKITALLSQLELLSRSDRKDAEEEEGGERSNGCQPGQPLSAAQ